MSRSIAGLFLAAGVAGMCATGSVASAQGPSPEAVTVSAAVTGVLQTGGPLGHGGDVEWGSLKVSGGVARQFSPTFSAGLSLHYGSEDWNISDAAAFGAPAPWQRVRRPGASLDMSVSLSPTLILGVSPMVNWAYDSTANAAGACTYGGVITAFKVFSPRFVIGAGATVTREFYAVRIQPFVIVDWHLTDRLRLANAIPAGPLADAGIELRYAPAPHWELAIGGVYRSDRWRLKARGPGLGDVGEIRSFPMLARVSRTLGPKARFDLYGGAMTAAELTVRDPDGVEIAHDDYGIAPMFSATLAIRFWPR